MKLDNAHINVIRERLKEKAEAGLLGVVSAQSRVPEFMLAEWCKDPLAIPGRDALIDLHNVLGEVVTFHDAHGEDHE